MTKAEIVAQISRQSGIEKTVVMTVVESFMENVKESMVAGSRNKKHDALASRCVGGSTNR